MSSLLDVGISSTHLFILGSVQVSTLFLFMNICAMRYLTAKTAKAMIAIRASPPAAASPPIKAKQFVGFFQYLPQRKHRLRLLDKSKTNMKEKEKL